MILSSNGLLKRSIDAYGEYDVVSIGTVGFVINFLFTDLKDLISMSTDF